VNRNKKHNNLPFRRIIPNRSQKMAEIKIVKMDRVETMERKSLPIKRLNHLKVVNQILHQKRKIVRIHVRETD